MACKCLLLVKLVSKIRKVKRLLVLTKFLCLRLVKSNQKYRRKKKKKSKKFIWLKMMIFS